MKLLSANYYYNGIQHVDLDKLKKDGIKLLLLDVDNTLVEHATENVSIEIKEFLDKAKAEGFILRIASNGKKERLIKFIDKIGIEGEGLLLKPLPFGIWRLIRNAGLTRRDAVMIGDQLFTDILGARLAGCMPIYVKRISDNEASFVKVKRKVEDWIVRKELER